MIRTFAVHEIRKSEELSSCLWDFRTMPEQGEGRHFPVTVPSCWETYPDTVSYRGKAGYSRGFRVPDGAGSVSERTGNESGTAGSGPECAEAGAEAARKYNVRLEFKGVSHTAVVLVDGRKVGEHYNAYTPFEVVLEGIPEGEHTLEVIADNSFGPDSALHVPNDYQSYGGISRGVLMEVLEDVYIRWLHFTPVRKSGKDNLWSGIAEVCLCNLSDRPFLGEVELRLDGRSLAVLPVELAGRESGCFRTEEVPCPGVRAWSPEEPALSRVSAVVKDGTGRAIDDLIDRTGFREVKIEGRDILLNGKKLLIKGFCRHEDHPQFGCALPFAAMQYDLMLIKDMGGNSVRTSHYPNDELFLDLCDEQGILVWEENHARGLSEEAMRNPNFERQCEDCIREMITAHYNHPSVYIWGILNECASHTEYGKECYRKQYELIRSLDPYRPRSSASCQFRTDICLGLPEVVSYNIYPKWYHDTPVKEYLEGLYGWVQTKTEGVGKPFLITETGAGAIYGYRTPAHVKWSEEYQAETLEEQITGVLAQPGCSGVYLWQLCDVRVCGSWFATRPRTMNNKGIVDEYRRPKLSYEVVKRLFGARGNYRENGG